MRKRTLSVCVTLCEVFPPSFSDNEDNEDNDDNDDNDDDDDDDDDDKAKRQ